jgi:hypothetical protein
MAGRRRRSPADQGAAASGKWGNRERRSRATDSLAYLGQRWSREGDRWAAAGCGNGGGAASSGERGSWPGSCVAVEGDGGSAEARVGGRLVVGTGELARAQQWRSLCGMARRRAAGGSASAAVALRRRRR